MHERVNLWCKTTAQAIGGRVWKSLGDRPKWECNRSHQELQYLTFWHGRGTYHIRLIYFDHTLVVTIEAVKKAYINGTPVSLSVVPATILDLVQYTFGSMRVAPNFGPRTWLSLLLSLPLPLLLSLLCNYCYPCCCHCCCCSCWYC